MNRSIVKGYLGELLVRAQLEKEGCAVTHVGNHAGYDLEWAAVRIDVKLSLLKLEIPNFPEYWGWALRPKNKVRNISCTHFVCAALNRGNEVDAYFVIKARDLQKFPKGISRFRNIANGFGILPSRLPRDCASDVREFFTESRRRLRDRKALMVSPNASLKEVLAHER